MVVKEKIKGDEMKLGKNIEIFFGTIDGIESYSESHQSSTPEKVKVVTYCGKFSDNKSYDLYVFYFLRILVKRKNHEFF